MLSSLSFILYRHAKGWENIGGASLLMVKESGSRDCPGKLLGFHDENSP